MNYYNDNDKKTCAYFPMKPAAKQLPLFTKSTGAIALRQASFRARELTDGSLFPFGANRKAGKRMADVDLTWYRWFLAQPWAGEWPGVAAYARDVLAPEREQQAQFARRPAIGHRQSAMTPKASDPVKAQAALDDFRQWKEQNK